MVRKFESADRLKLMRISPVNQCGAECFWPLMFRAPYYMHSCAIKRSRRYQTTVYFTMIKDVLHIMFTLVRKRKDSSFWSCKYYCEWSQGLRVRTGSSRRKSRQRTGYIMDSHDPRDWLQLAIVRRIYSRLISNFTDIRPRMLYNCRVSFIMKYCTVFKLEIILSTESEMVWPCESRAAETATL